MNCRFPPIVLLVTACLATLIVLQLQRNPLDAAPADSNDKTNSSTYSLFNGKTLEGWDGDSNVFRVEEKSIVGGQLKEKIAHNFFLASNEEYADFELTLEFKLVGDDTNAGVQIRSRRIPDHHEMIGYQADLGQNYWGALYDESRRNKVLASPDKEGLASVLKPDEWNRYRILCEGPHIQLWINDFRTVNYTEDDEKIEQSGLIALQIHGGPPGEAHYRNIRIQKLNTDK